MASKPVRIEFTQSGLDCVESARDGMNSKLDTVGSSLSSLDADADKAKRVAIIALILDALDGVNDTLARDARRYLRRGGDRSSSSTPVGRFA